MRPYLIAAAFLCLSFQSAFGQAASPADAAKTGTKAADPSHSAAPAAAPAGQGNPATPVKRVAPAPKRVLQTRVAPIEGTDWRFAYPDATMRMSINLGRILRSPMVADALKNVPSGMQTQANVALKMIEGIDTVQLSVRQVPSVPAPGSQAASTTPFGNNNADVLVLITGQLDPALRQMIAQQGTAKAMTARQIAPDVLLLGKTAQVESAVQRMKAAPVSGDTDSLADSDIWISGDTALVASSMAAGVSAKAKDASASGNGASAAGNVASAMPGIDIVKRFSLGIDVRDPFGLSVNLLAANEAGADQLLSLYNFAMAASAGKTPVEFSDLVDRVHVEKQGSELQFRFSAPVALIQKVFADSKSLQNLGSNPALPAGISGLFGVQSAGAASSATPQSAPAAKGKIMIYGLDEGPREVGAPRKN